MNWKLLTIGIIILELSRLDRFLPNSEIAFFVSVLCFAMTGCFIGYLIARCE